MMEASLEVVPLWGSHEKLGSKPKPNQKLAFSQSKESEHSSKVRTENILGGNGVAGAGDN